jgi:hypothetical protein
MMTTITEESTELTQEESTQNESPSILRTAESGCWEVYNGTWGSYLRSAFDPDANAVITEDHLKHFELNENIHRIPAELWSKWIKLCFHYVDKVEACVEVSMRILRSQEDPSIYRLLVPKQKVCGASVRVDSFDEAIDLDTGEEITSYPPEGWVPVGSSHSHNTMQAFFSGVDDKYELGDPGIHIVVGSINTKDMKYTIAASVVGSGRRFDVPFDKIIDATPISGVTFHPKVLDYVDYTSPVSTYSIKGGFSKYPTSWIKKVSSAKTSPTKTNWENLDNWGWNGSDDYCDPFYWNGNSASNLGVWNVIDVAKDFALEHNKNPKLLKELRDELYDFLSDLEVLLEDEVESLF